MIQPTPLKIRFYGDPCLRKKSEAVKNIGPGERFLIESMILTMIDAKGIGLAAPQVGINQRIFVADVGEGPIAIINPEIIKKSGSSKMEEGCLSIPAVNVIVKRPDKIHVKYKDENNKPHERDFDGLLARVIQHETDHLDGKMIVDYASIFKKRKIKKILKLIEEEKWDEIRALEKSLKGGKDKGRKSES